MGSFKIIIGFEFGFFFLVLLFFVFLPLFSDLCDFFFLLDDLGFTGILTFTIKPTEPNITLPSVAPLGSDRLAVSVLESSLFLLLVRLFVVGGGASEASWVFSCSSLALSFFFSFNVGLVGFFGLGSSLKTASLVPPIAVYILNNNNLSLLSLAVISVFNISHMRFLIIPFFGLSVRKAEKRFSKILLFMVFINRGSKIRSMADKGLVDPLAELVLGQIVSIDIMVRIELIIGSG